MNFRFLGFSAISNNEAVTVTPGERDQPGGLQHQQGARAIGRIVGNGDLGARRQVVQLGHALGIDAHLLHHGGGDRHQVIAARLVLRVQEGLVLVDVQVQLLASSAALGWMKSLNSTSLTFRPSLAATSRTTSPICACGPTVTPTLSSASWAEPALRRCRRRSRAGRTVGPGSGAGAWEFSRDGSRRKPGILDSVPQNRKR